MKKLLSYLITLIVGIIGGIYCHDKVRDTAVGWLDKRVEKRRKKHMHDTTYYPNFKYAARPWNYLDTKGDYEYIWFSERADAERVLSRMRNEAETNFVSVADLKILSGLQADFWSDHKFGWTDLSEAKVYKGKNGKFYLDLPEPFPIDDQED